MVQKMKNKDRLIILESIKNINERRQETSEFFNRLKKGYEKALSVYELEQFDATLNHAKDPITLRYLWLIAIYSDYSSKIEAYAKSILADNKNICRDLALKYLFSKTPENTEMLIAKYEDDINPEVLYAVAQQIREKDTVKAVYMMIDILPETLESQELYDAITVDIYENGEKEHLEKMKEYMKYPHLEDCYYYPIEVLKKKIEL